MFATGACIAIIRQKNGRCKGCNARKWPFLLGFWKFLARSGLNLPIFRGFLAPQCPQGRVFRILKSGFGMSALPLLNTLLGRVYGCVGLLGLLFACAAVRAEEPVQPQWISLFDGKTGRGWHEAGGKDFPASWRVRNGCLEPVAGLPVFQDLVTDETFTDFEFVFRFRLAKNVNSGVKYALQKFDRWRPKGLAEEVKGEHARARGPEFQIVDSQLEPEMGSKQTAGALYGQVAPQPVLHLEAGVEHEGRIKKVGNHVQHWLDGQKVVETELPVGGGQGEGAGQQASPLALQNHGNKLPAGEAAACYFDLRVRRLR